MTLTQAYVLLAVAIAGEIISTGTLKATDGFTKWTPSLISILAISICMFTMSHVVKILPIGRIFIAWDIVYMHIVIAKIQIIEGIHLVKPSVAFKVPVEIISPAIATANNR